MRPSAILNRKALQLYVVAMLGMFCYLHLRYGRNYSKKSTLEASELSSSSSRLVDVSHHDQNAGGSYSSMSRFILGLNYWEQFTMATGNLLSLVCLGEQWNATIVQPFTFNSRLYGLQNFKPDDNFHQNRSAHPLDLIYDMDSFSWLLHKYSLPRLATFRTFLRRASREVIVAHYISPKETHELVVMKGDTKNLLEREFRRDSVIDCRNHLRTYSTMIETALNRELNSYPSLTSKGQFRVSKYWCVNMSEFSTPQKSAQKMDFGVSEEATIIILNWRGVGKKQVVMNSAKGLHLNNRVAMFNACRHHHLGIQWRDMIMYSPGVLETSRLFAASLGIAPTDAYAAVHIRSEKLGLREKRLTGMTQICFKELMRQVDDLAQKHPLLKFVYITDYGPYSSDTCRKCRGSREVYKHLLKRNIRTVYFDPARFNATLDSGFAAAVESHFLASASVLFLCGGGGYQTQISARFQNTNHRTLITNNQNRSIFKVCSDDNDISKLLKLKPNDLTSGMQ